MHSFCFSLTINVPLLTPSGPIYVRLISILFNSVHVDWKLLDWVRQKAPFDDTQF